MSRRSRPAIVLGLAGLFIVLGLIGSWLYRGYGWALIPSPDEGVDVTFRFDNRSERAVGPLVLVSSATDTSLTVSPLASGARRSIRFVNPTPSGENSIVLLDPKRREYVVVGYFEAPLGGTVDIRIDSVSSDGELSGASRSWVSYFGSREWVSLR